MALDETLVKRALAAAERCRDLELKLNSANENFTDAVRGLHDSGASLRQIATALNLSHLRIHQLVVGSDASVWARLRRTATKAELENMAACTLEPATAVSVTLDSDTRTAHVLVPKDQLSLAIGRFGQNAQLAAELTGWRVDIKSVENGIRTRLEALAVLCWSVGFCLEELKGVPAQGLAETATTHLGHDQPPGRHQRDPPQQMPPRSQSGDRSTRRASSESRRPRGPACRALAASGLATCGPCPQRVPSAAGRGLIGPDG